MIVKVFPTVLIALDVIVAVVYLYDGDYRKTIYWLSASVLTASVTY